MTAGELLAACAMDVVLGDPRGLPHPVRLMGRIIVRFERLVRGLRMKPVGEGLAGAVLAIGLPGLVYAVGWTTIEVAERLHMVVGKIAVVVLAFYTLAARDLSDHALGVFRALESGALEEGRQAVSRIVGRDTAGLPEEEVVRATVETVAESTADGIIAPLFFLTLGGPPLALAYKAVNTLDSMVGHQNQQYRYLGWASARLDDVANWIPARLAALFLVLAAGLVARNAGRVRKAWQIFRRDGAHHPSPNSGHPEAAMAGALLVRLGGTNYYAGHPEQRPYLGDPVVPLHRSHITQAVTCMWTATALAAILAMGLLWL